MRTDSLGFTPHQDKNELVRLKQYIDEYQTLANKHGIDDIFQDNGGKVLQLIILLGIKTLPGRSGNDAIDENGLQYEIKTRNINKTKYYTTSHHLTAEIINKYRIANWIFAEYDGIELIRVYSISGKKLSGYFNQWSEKYIVSGYRPLNNPKINAKFISDNAELVFDTGSG